MLSNRKPCGFHTLYKDTKLDSNCVLDCNANGLVKSSNLKPFPMEPAKLNSTDQKVTTAIADNISYKTSDQAGELENWG